ncbi:MAG TPA: helix-turn-helix domain-containing protein [Pyrinomonadaceae bacterium]|nr:helix-turn-helix domain-containing protein [Pyrinomonadaceae bacterium]
MVKGKTSQDDNILSALDERVRRIAEEVVRAHAASGDIGAVKVKPTAMKMLDMSESRVRALIREGRLQVIRPTPNTIRIPLSEIRKFQEGEK